MTLRFPDAVSFLVLALLLTLSTTPAATADPAADPQAAEDSTLEWGQRTVDLYVDARLRPDGMVLQSDAAWAVVLPDRDDAWVFSETAAGEPRVQVLPRQSFTWSDPLNATSPRPGETVAEKVAGTWTELPEGYAAIADGVAIVTQRHVGPAGVLEADELWAAVPYWRRLGETWRAEQMGRDEGGGDGEATAWHTLGELAGAGSGISFEASLGTWCGDSRRSVPKLLMAAEELGLDVSLVAIRRGFEEPLDYARDHRITNVPTVIVRRHGVEIGRFVERPRGASVITDLAAILEGRPAPPPERWNDTDALLASGEYLLRGSDGAALGRETWSLFRTEDGGTRLGSRRVGADGSVTEVWQRWNSQSEGGRTSFVEVTRQGGGELSRTRLYRRHRDAGEDSLSSLTRGNTGGIVEQQHSIPSDAIVLTPTLGGLGLAWVAAGRQELSAAPVLTVPGTGDGFAARLADAEARQVADGHVVLRVAGATTQLWLDPQLGVPVRIERDGVTAELVTLERN